MLDPIAIAVGLSAAFLAVAIGIGLYRQGRTEAELLFLHGELDNLRGRVRWLEYELAIAELPGDEVWNLDEKDATTCNE